MLAVLARELGLAPARIRQRAQMVLRDLVHDCSNSTIPFLRLDPIRAQLQVSQAEDALLAREALVADLTRILEQLSRQAPHQVDSGVDHLTQEDLARHAGVHCRTVRRWRDQGLIFEWSKYQEKAQLLVSRVEADRFLKARLSRTSRGFRHSEEVKRLSLLDPEQAKHIPRETLRRWKNQGKRRDRVREDRAAGLAWRWGIAAYRWNRHAGISDDTRRRRVQRDRVRRLQQANANHGIVAPPRVSGAPEAVHQFVQSRWVAHEMIVALKPSSPFDLIVEAEDVLRRCGWWYPKCFEGTPQQDGALAALLAAILAGESVRFAGRLRIEVERAQHGVLRPWDASDPFGFALPGFGCRRDLLSDDLRALATRWLGMDQDAPSSWLELCPNRGRRGRTEDQRLILQAAGPFRPGPKKSGDLSVAAKIF